MRTKLRCKSDAEQSVGQGWCWARRRLRPLQGQKGQSNAPEETNSLARPQRAGRGSGTAEARSLDRAAVLWGPPRSKDSSTAGSLERNADP